ncbi:uncharacterized protein LOC132612661 [Lycium barbarum]|uniref:uncharacterized protein LOC132612661 n=1 Tax=Lycium barbarum TaxID=112863 RepID=UPI00293F66F2|nr:uncharacterized protein LOC132612661 [Lycium barbarum]
MGTMSSNFTLKMIEMRYYSGPYTINNRLIILKPWSMDFDFNAEFPTQIPLWVKFPHLPMSYWGKDSLSRVASLIGVPIYADECTTKQTRITYARMLVEVNITQTLPDEVIVLGPAAPIPVQVTRTLLIKGKLMQASSNLVWELSSLLSSSKKSVLTSKKKCIVQQKTQAQPTGINDKRDQPGPTLDLTNFPELGTAVAKKKNGGVQCDSSGNSQPPPSKGGGDFNAVLHPSDRLFGASITATELKDFNDCVQQLNITELSWRGEYYTWSNKQLGTDRICSRIDRLFGNVDWMMKWGHVTTDYDLPHVSDHAPMLLNIQEVQWSIKTPFRFFNIWAGHDSFLRIVKIVWDKKLDSNKMGNVWKKLKTLRGELRKLNEQEFKFLSQKIAHTRMELLSTQDQINNQCNDTLLAKEKQYLHDLERWSLIEESAIQQKARAHWIRLVDGNNKYFSAMIKEMTHKKQLLELTSLSGIKLTTPAAIKKEITEFYKSLMGTASQALPAVNIETMRKGPVLSHAQGIELCKEITEVEIWTALQSINDDKSPGVDGYNAFFFKKSWNIIKTEIVAPISDFFRTGQMHRAINCTLLTLVPKTPNPANIKEYRPIACCSVLYKIIAKILDSRLQKVMTTIINEAQFGFIPRRKIADNIILANKQVRAYSRKPISARGDLASVSAIFDKFQSFSLASGLQANRGKSSLYFGGVTEVVKNAIKQQLGFGVGELPFKYLGIPFSTKTLSTLQWSPLIDKMVARISSWTAKKLSYAGRVQLVQSVFFGIQSYWSQMFVIPSKVLKVIDAFCRSYIWSGTNTITKRALIAWDRMCLPISAGGLNLINVQIWNKASIAKPYWDLARKSDKLWIRWIHSYYLKGEQLATALIPKQTSWMVRKIIDSRSILEQHLVMDEQNLTIRKLYLAMVGDRTRMEWKDLMFNNGARLKAKFTLWLQLQNRLPTTDRLQKWGLAVDWKCKLCNVYMETRDHLYV